MDELAKKIQQKYIEDITSRYPLYRFFCLLIYLFSYYVYFTTHKDSLLMTTKDIKISFLFNFSSGLISEVSIFGLTVSVTLTIVGSQISKIINSRSFRVMAKLNNFDQYVSDISQKAHKVKSEKRNINIETNILGVDAKRALLKGKQAISETALTLSICTFPSILYYSVTDIVVFIGCLVIVAYSQIESFKLYISEFMPSFIYEQVLLGNTVEFSDNNEPHT
ncbi:hypothetical protein O5O45_08500 [Hahella aquimaris]|uniref:hypothetical protein n=1 Tax=Hahella sp. HNIBRBA332 TaxID=3015983 RepID=UPI00273B2E81|nr:hypothetical protein [Hahella sp. HNIBRBA332]WLQ15953.1 hypothetical protein O5O45_08500 [Hahella sp. HNIBRBA332]